MSYYGKITTVTPNAASNTSLTSVFEVPKEFSHFAFSVPTVSGWCVTSTCNIRVEVSDAEDGTFYEVGYSANPATATTGVAAESWGSGNAPGGKMIICEALMFSPGYARLKFVNTATATADFVIYGRQFQ